VEPAPAPADTPPLGTADPVRVVPGPTYPSPPPLDKEPPPLDKEPPLRDEEDAPDRLDDDDEDEDGRRESVGVEGIAGGDTRLSPPPDEVEEPPPDDPPDDPPDEPDEDDPPVRGIAVWADRSAGTAKAAVTDRTTSERE